MTNAKSERSEWREDLKIDKYDLDNELNEHSRLYEKWSNRLAEAEYYRDKALRKLDVTKAQADYDIRTNPDKYGWNDSDRPPTEPFVKTAINRNTAVKFAERDLIKCKLRVKKLAGAVRSFEHRKMGIGEMCRLWAKQFYSRPYVPKEAKEIKKEVQEKSEQAQDEALADCDRLNKLADVFPNHFPKGGTTDDS